MLRDQVNAGALEEEDSEDEKKNEDEESIFGASDILFDARSPEEKFNSFRLKKVNGKLE